MKTKSILATSCLATALVCTASLSQAAVLNVITPTGVSVVDTTGNYAGGDINNLINNSGLSATIGATVDTDALPTVTESDPEVNGWRRNGATAPAVDFIFTFASASSFSGLLIGNYWEGGAAPKRGVSAFGLEISTDNGGSYTLVQTVNPLQSTGNIEYIDLGTTYTGVTNVRFNDATNFPGGDGTGNSNILGLNEVRFTAVPEPSAALIGGLGMLALLRRRRA